uniref:Uncharacterized protein n=1 Tax=Fagus sylvatica TaxID=28930 RepID=A0A2N9EHE9_FAGSY
MTESDIAGFCSQTSVSVPVLPFYDDLELMYRWLPWRINSVLVPVLPIWKKPVHVSPYFSGRDIRSDKVMELSAGFFLSAAGATSGLIWRTAAFSIKPASPESSG